ncbi:DUF4845 domain-containing protein [Gammaproteobacteria bacterium]
MKSKQHGMSFWGVMAITAMTGFFVLLAMKLFPVYSDDLKVKNTLDVLEKSGNGRSREAIIEQFARQLDINDVRSVQPTKLKLEPIDSGFSADLTYEVRVPIVYNVDAVVKFSHHRDLP